MGPTGRSLRLALAFTLAGCAGTGPQAVLNQEVELTPGQALRIAGTDRTVTFVDVPQDSRCPVGATCIWAGNAEVRLRLRAGSLDTLFSVNTGQEPKSATAGRLRFELRGLMPVPHVNLPVDGKLYRARVLIGGIER